MKHSSGGTLQGNGNENDAHVPLTPSIILETFCYKFEMIHLLIAWTF